TPGAAGRSLLRSVCVATESSAFQPHPCRCMIAGAFPGARFTVDARFRGVFAQGVGDEREIDAQAEVAAKAGLAVVPPAEDTGLVVVHAEGIVQAQRLQPLQ